MNVHIADYHLSFFIHHRHIADKSKIFIAYVVFVSKKDLSLEFHLSSTVFKNL